MRGGDHSPHILLVEDDESVRIALAEVLRLYGYRLTEAASAAEANPLLDGRRFDAVITDIVVPGSGFSTLERSRQTRPEVPVIMITGSEDPRLRRRALDGGAFAFLHKPVTGAELRGTLDRALGDS